MASDYIAVTGIASIVMLVIASVAAVIAVIWGSALALQIALTVVVIAALIFFAMALLTQSGVFD